MANEIYEINEGSSEIIFRPMTKEEKAHRNEVLKNTSDEMNRMIQDFERDNQPSIDLKQSAISKLTALGLTEEEAKAIAGL